MRLRTLKIEQFRGFPQATELAFHEQFTLIAGENGVGKSGILRALCVLLSQIVHAGPKRSAYRLPFRVEDVAVGWPFLRAEAVVHSIPERMASTCTAQKYVSDYTYLVTDDGRPREVPIHTPDSYRMKYEGERQDRTGAELE